MEGKKRQKREEEENENEWKEDGKRERSKMEIKSEIKLAITRPPRLDKTQCVVHEKEISQGFTIRRLSWQAKFQRFGCKRKILN
ncbi:hypothetical protein PoB_000438900 [Plakobranchus ocellatus]|uniref:Uncharacterized protein n=1 Tax=Plakobranchus ocellatus TaxID=259542 RepID=A0AAV3Y6J3_9GAST|nr:hypothetical protein PoB_000438900 [Plakobranchus ocellatus]